MRIVFALILIIGMGLAGFAVYMAQGRFNEYQTVLDSQRRALQKNVPLTKVIVAAHADARAKVDAEMQAKMQEVTGGLPLPPGLKLF